jgi:hypothetical protein
MLVSRKSFLIAACFFAATSFAASGSVTSSPSGTPSAEQRDPSWKDLFDEQAKEEEKALSAQQKIYQAAIDSTTRSLQTMQMVLAVGALGVSIFGAFFGVWIKGSLDRVDVVADRAKELLAEVQLRIAEFENRQKELDVKVAQCQEKVTPLSGEIERCGREFDHFREVSRQVGSVEDLREKIESVLFKARLAEMRVDLLSGRDDEKLRAAQQASEIARSDRGAPAIPLLLDCLRSDNMDPSIVAEALYGLSTRGKVIAQDRDAINLVLKASRSPFKGVRLQAVLTMGSIQPMQAVIQTRLAECAESDADREVKAAAERILRGDEAGSTSRA